MRPEDILGLRLSCKRINYSIGSDITTIKHLLDSLKHKYDDKILETLQNKSLRQEYDIDSPKLEKLMKEYLKDKKSPGQELHELLAKAVAFMNSEIKVTLGIKPGVIQPKAEKQTGYLSRYSY